MEILIGWLGFLCVFGVIGGIITANKNRGTLPGFLLGFFLNVLGLIIAAVLAPLPGQPLVPSGMRAVRCVRCNADQNVPADAPSAECWQCKTEMDLSARLAKSQSAAPAVQMTDAPTLAAALELFPNGELPRSVRVRVKVIKIGDPNFGKHGNVVAIKDGLAHVHFGIFWNPVTYAYGLDVLQPTGRW